MAGKNDATNEPTLVLTRVFDAPRELVFKVWTESEHLERWQNAPQGFSVISHERDFRIGGHFRICMRSPEGVDHWLQGVYREIVAPERLSFTHVWLNAEGNPIQETLMTISLAECDGKTRLTLHQTGFKSVASRDGHMVGWNSTLERLAEYLAKLSV